MTEAEKLKKLEPQIVTELDLGEISVFEIKYTSKFKTKQGEGKGWYFVDEWIGRCKVEKIVNARANTTHFKFSTNDNRKHRTSRKH